jgi:branched-chain amino acid transport system substrate-binding protein
MFSYEAEAKVYARHILANFKEPKIAILSQNDDFGRDFVRGLKAGLGTSAKNAVVAEATYESTDPKVDSQILALKASGANIFMNFSNGKFASQALRNAAELGWKVQLYLPIGSSSISSILRPAGVENALGAVTIASSKNPLDPQWQDDPGMKEYFEFMKRWAPGLDPNDSLNVTGITIVKILADVLRRCGDELTRDNVMRQILSLKDYTTPWMLPGVTLTTGKDDYELYASSRLTRFDGKSWLPIGEAVGVR